ncbi:hypothetical protein LSAT2_029472 [Lamellibrachia satsuma]|nr:hypothetical protein LSAT2_029472 [Lamellibrachia satsuma]
MQEFQVKIVGAFEHMLELDINECLLVDENGVGLCGNGSSCQNLPGSCRCICPAGFTTPDAKTCAQCKDIDECVSKVYPHQCTGDKQCINKAPFYDCVCKDGYRTAEDTCTEIDECSESAGLCGTGSCQNTKGAYMCNCPAGFEFTDGTCSNINECYQPLNSEYAHNCENSTCSDEEPGYKCNCWPGYKKGSATRCVDIDECRTPMVCGDHSECVNVVSSYTCVCHDGYVWNSNVCADRNECEWFPDICGSSQSATCENEAGSYTCSCNQGYQLTKYGKCTDIDECLEEVALCGAGELMCVNLEGSYKCICPPGYTAHGGSCVNLDECATHNHHCDVNMADCVDTVGSYKCNCRSGFVGNGRHCSPICQPGLCPGKQMCTVTEGEAICSCKCSGGDCSNTGPVCGSNGQTYDSQTALLLVACRSGKDITLDYHGVCQAGGLITTIGGNSKGALCVFPFIYQGLSYTDCINGTTGTAWCSTTSNYDTDGKSGDCVYEVCSVSGETFSTYCKFQQRMCALNSDEDIAHFGRCINTKECVYGEYGTWSGCSVSCGQGFKFRWRAVLDKPDWPPNACRAREQKKKCNEAPCRGDKCETYGCRGPAEFCVLHNDQPVCECPNCAFEPRRPVCGMLGDQMITFYNLCKLKFEACAQARNYTLLHDGDCLDGLPNEPLMCTVMRRYKRVTDDAGCRTADVERVFSCQGGCGKVTGYCCDPTVFNYKRMQFVCSGGKTKFAKVLQVQQCGCIPGRMSRKLSLVVAANP